MKVHYNGKVAEVWVIGKSTPKPDWVEKALAEHYIVWMDNHVRVLMTALNPSVSTNLKSGAIGTIGSGFAGYNMYVLGYPGDVLDVTNHRIISAKQFAKQYTVNQSERGVR